LVFGNDAWTIVIKDFTVFEGGAFHTNTVAGLQLAMDLLEEKKYQQTNFDYRRCRAVFVKRWSYYMNSNGLDEYIVDKCYSQAQQARKLHIPITTFMIANDPYLQQFVNNKPYGNNQVKDFDFEDYETNRKKKIK
jgi:uncharacterized protein with von Willebrand factor type A (vWA) domain